jgi:hypothetical protein
MPNGLDARLGDRKTRRIGIMVYYRRVMRQRTASFALRGVMGGFRPTWLT